MLRLRTRFAGIIALPAICLTVQWAAPSATAQDIEVPSACSDGSSPTWRPAPSDPASSAGAFPEPQVRESSDGKLKTTLHACIGRNKVVDQPSGETRVIHTTAYEGTIPGPTLVVKPGDKLVIDLINN